MPIRMVCSTLVLAAIVACGDEHRAPGPGTPDELARRVFAALKADDARAYAALSPTVEQLEWLINLAEDHMSEEGIDVLRGRLERSGGPDGMHERMLKERAEDFAYARARGGDQLDWTIAEFVGLDESETVIETNSDGLEQAEVFFRVRAGDATYRFRIFQCAKVGSGWVTGTHVRCLGRETR